MSNRTTTLGAAGLLLVGILACGGGGRAGGSPQAPTAPSVPSGLVAQGGLRTIHLGWSASTGSGLTGYNIFRSTDGATWTKLAGPVAATAFDDAIASPTGDGVIYQYQVTAVGAVESAPSAKVQTVHGTRLPASNSAGFTTTASGSPYVAEGTVVVNGGNLVVDSGTKLYLLDGASVDLEQGAETVGRFWVKGLLRVLATPAVYARITAHRVGGALANQEGLAIWFDGAVNYNPSDGSGTLLQNTLITNLASGNTYGAILIRDCAPRLYNLNATANSSTGGSYIFLNTGAGAFIQNCAFNKIVAAVQADLRGTTFKLDHNRFRGGFYALYFGPLNTPGITLGQIDANDFDGTRQAALFSVSGTANIPVGNNFWNGGSGAPPLPAELRSDSTVFCAFSPALATAPANTGPTWQ